MKRRAARASMLGALLALLGACSTPQLPPAPPVQETIEQPGKPVLAVSAREEGQRVVLEAGQELVVSLPLGEREVNTNFEWTITDPAPGAITVLGSKFERGARDSNPGEAGGTVTWRLKPNAAGRIDLKFALRRPHALDAPLRTIGYELLVK